MDHPCKSMTVPMYTIHYAIRPSHSRGIDRTVLAESLRRVEPPFTLPRSWNDTTAQTAKRTFFQERGVGIRGGCAKPWVWVRVENGKLNFCPQCRRPERRGRQLLVLSDGGRWPDRWRTEMATATPSRLRWVGPRPWRDDEARGGGEGETKSGNRETGWENDRAERRSRAREVGRLWRLQAARLIGSRRRRQREGTEESSEVVVEERKRTDGLTFPIHSGAASPTRRGARRRRRNGTYGAAGDWYNPFIVVRAHTRRKTNHCFGGASRARVTCLCAYLAAGPRADRDASRVQTTRPITTPW